MPVSDPVNMGIVAIEIARLSPRNILDVGVGFGKYGFIARQVLDASRNHYWDFQTKITGIEIFPKYILPHHRALYNNFLIGNVTDFPVEAYDLAIFGDIIEHLKKEEGESILKAYKEKCKNVLVSCPNGHYEQGEVYGNIHETHLSDWREEDFLRLGGSIIGSGAILTVRF